MTTPKPIVFTGGAIKQSAKGNIVTLWVDGGYRRVEINMHKTPVEEILQKVKALQDEIGLDNIKNTIETCPNCENPLVNLCDEYVCFKCKVSKSAVRQMKPTVSEVRKN